MKNIIVKTSLTILCCAVLFLAACSTQTSYNPEANHYDLTVGNDAEPISLEPDYEYNASVLEIFKELQILWTDGNIQYGWRFIDGKCALYRIEDNGLSIVRLALIEPQLPFIDIHRSGIFDFGITDEWIILSIGEFQGSGWYFYGNFVRMRKDGSEIEHFWLTDSHNFNVIGDWIYYHYWSHQPAKQEGIYRIRPDGSDKEFMGHILHSIIVYAEDGWVYATQATDEIINTQNPVINFIRWNPESEETIILFMGSTLLEIEGAHSIRYLDIKTGLKHIYFTVVVEGHDLIGFRDVFPILYSANYRVEKDGSNLEMLNERFTQPIDFTTTKRINSELPYFTFRFQGETIRENYWSTDGTRYILGSPMPEIQSITIANDSGEIIQIIADLYLRYIRLDALTFDDWNFDGYLDFALPYFDFHATAYFLWDSASNLFVRNWDLENFGGRYGVETCHETERLIVSGGRMGLYFTVYYKFIDGVITMVKAIEEWHEFIEETEEGYLFVIHTTVSELVDGEMTVVRYTTYDEVWN